MPRLPGPPSQRRSTWPGASSEKYVSHEACGEPKDLEEWKDNKKVYFSEVCVRVVVQQSCGCRSFETSYRKYKGAAKYTHAGTAGSTKVDCPADAVFDDACKAQLAKEKAEREAEAKKKALCGDTPDFVRVYTARRIDAYCPQRHRQE